jgi:large subunit ribosomal protein L10
MSMERRVFARHTCEAKIFLSKGGKKPLAVTKEHKQEIVATYQDWIGKSQAVFLTEYTGLSVKDIDALRAKIREVGGEFHIIKNTLGKLAFEGVGYEVPQSYFLGSTAAGFAFEDAASMAKALADFGKSAESLKLKGGYLESRIVNIEEIKSLAALPPLPVVQAQLLGTLMAPANQLARILVEPARQMASVFKSYAETEASPAES